MSIVAWADPAESMLKRDKLKIIPGRADPAQSGYVLDAQVGFLMRVAMQRHTSIFMSAMASNGNREILVPARETD